MLPDNILTKHAARLNITGSIDIVFGRTRVKTRILRYQSTSRTESLSRAIYPVSDEVKN
jgi:hypothetical protein